VLNIETYVEICNSLDKLRHTRFVAYSVEYVLLNKQLEIHCPYEIYSKIEILYWNIEILRKSKAPVASLHILHCRRGHMEQSSFQRLQCMWLEADCTKLKQYVAFDALHVAAFYSQFVCYIQHKIITV